jgi:hypothetical protein
MNITSARLASACAAGMLALTLAACGGSTSPAVSVPSTTSSPGSSAPGSGPTPSTGTKVSANTASEAEIAAALESAGVSNAGRWAEEVVEYRPYPADDPNLTKLRESLAKYNPGQETTDKIVAVLTP